MGGFLSLIDSLALGLFVICGFFLTRNLWIWMSARHELQWSQFGLEREMAERRGGRALTFILLMVETIIFVWAISGLALPAWSEGLPSTPDSNANRQFKTNIPPGDGDSGLIVDVGTAAPTDVLSTAAPPSTPAGTIGPRDPRAGCDPSTAWIEYPANGMYVFQEEPVLGTANVPNFASYRFEIRSVESSDFSVYRGDYDQPVTEGPLGTISPSVLLPGEYRFRIVVFDNTNEVRARCEITITITDPVPTPTPIGAGSLE